MKKKTAGEPEQKTTFNPFLKAEHVKAGDTVTLTGWTVLRDSRNGFGPQIVMEVTHDRTGKTYDYAIKEGSPTHRKLFKRMGREPKNWSGKLTLGVDSGTFGKFIIVEDAASESAPF